MIFGMHPPPTEQLIRDYLNRLSVAGRDKLGLSQRQALLDRTRARIEAECGGVNGASAVQVRKALADLGDPMALVEREASRADSATNTGDARYEVSIAGNGNREMVAEPAYACEVVNGSEIGEDLFVTGGPNGSKPERSGAPEPDDGSGRGGGSVRSALASFAASPRRRRRSAGAVSAGGDPASADPAIGEAASAGSGGPEAGKRGLIPLPRRPAAPDGTGASDPRAAQGGGEGSTGPGGRKQNQPGGPRSAGAGPAGTGSGSASSGTGSVGAGPVGTGSAGAGSAGRLVRRGVAAARNHTLEVLAIVLLGVGGAAYPPIWLVGAALALPSKKWDMRDKFLGITLPVFLLIIGIVLILVLGGQRATLSDYAYEAWLGAGRLSRVLAASGAIYLAWGLHRGRRQPKQPPWNVPHRIG
jgi:hypothetical protein